MSRNLVLCLDGTSNRYEKANTNVVKLYAMLDRAGDALCYYQPGIGTMPPPGMWERTARWLITRLDLATACLLNGHVCDAYRFLMRTYEDGDRIYIFGFSRGAYSARVLAGMLHKVGLLGRGNEELVPFAWDIYERHVNFELSTGFRRTFGRKVRVRFLGLWDTVSSVGWAEWNPTTYDFTFNNESVDSVRHAVALDERRAYFVQNLWTSTPPVGQDVVQIWFSGVHCDVGGGYREADAGLAKIALAWMTREAEAAGLGINPGAKNAILPAADAGGYVAPGPLGTSHESLRGWWWIPELLPKRIRDATQNYQPKWIFPRGRHRTVPDGALIHESVFARMQGDPTYKPPNLPRAYIEANERAKSPPGSGGNIP